MTGFGLCGARELSRMWHTDCGFLISVLLITLVATSVWLHVITPSILEL